MLLARWALAWLFLFPAACGEVLPKAPDAPPAPDGLPDGTGAGPTLFWVEANAACDASAIRRSLEEIGRRGWALVDQELEIDLRSIAVPVHDRRDRVVAA